MLSFLHESVNAQVNKNKQVKKGTTYLNGEFMYYYGLYKT